MHNFEVGQEYLISVVDLGISSYPISQNPKDRKVTIGGSRVQHPMSTYVKKGFQSKESFYHRLKILHLFQLVWTFRPLLIMNFFTYFYDRNHP